MTKENKFKIGLCLQGIALSMDDATLERNKDRLKQIEDIIIAEPTGNEKSFDIETYCKEHFCVMVDRDVWDKVTNRLVKSKAKCKDCIYLSSEKNTIGRLCINPSKIFRTKTSCWKHTTTPACKLFKAR